jgi:hypothetical protein
MIHTSWSDIVLYLTHSWESLNRCTNTELNTVLYSSSIAFRAYRGREWGQERSKSQQGVVFVEYLAMTVKMSALYCPLAV